MITGKYPNLRLRRNRKNTWSRRLVAENNLSANDFILPIFLIEGKNKTQPIKSMPDVFRYSIDNIGRIIDRAIKNQVPMVALFPNSAKKLKDNLGVFSEGRYLYYWQKPAYDIKMGINYQFMGF